MATFEPGHLHIQRAALQSGDFSYDLKVDYEVVQDPKDGTAMQFTMHGEINGKPLKEVFSLPRDLAFNFASEAFHIAVKHGMPKSVDLRGMHGHYDKMFEDVRAKLHAHSGEPVKPEHLS